MPHHLWREGSPPALGHSRKQRIQGRKRRKREDDIRRESKKGKGGGSAQRGRAISHILISETVVHKKGPSTLKRFFLGGKGERRVEEYASGLLRSFTFLLSAQHQTLFFTPYSKEEEKGGLDKRQFGSGRTQRIMEEEGEKKEVEVAAERREGRGPRLKFTGSSAWVGVGWGGGFYFLIHTLNIRGGRGREGEINLEKADFFLSLIFCHTTSFYPAFKLFPFPLNPFSEEEAS